MTITITSLIGAQTMPTKSCLKQKVRCTPVKMEVDAILILHGWILEIEGEAADAGELLAICTLWGIRRSAPNSHGLTNRFQSFGEYSGATK